MSMRFWAAAVALIATAAVYGTAAGQTKANGPAQLTPCSEAHRSGRHIVSDLEIVEFYLPTFAKMKKAADVDYVEYFVRYGAARDKLWLKFMFGRHVGGEPPDELGDRSIQWTAQEWGCHQDKDGTDWSGIGADGRRWRYISIPFGFAAYRGVPAKAAGHFDKILDTMCCGKCRYCASTGFSDSRSRR